MVQKEMQDFWAILSMVSGWPIITSGLGLSLVMAPLGPWPLERGRGDPAGTWSRPALEAQLRIDFPINAFLVCFESLGTLLVVVKKVALLAARLRPIAHSETH